MIVPSGPHGPLLSLMASVPKLSSIKPNFRVSIKKEREERKEREKAAMSYPLTPPSSVRSWVLKLAKIKVRTLN